MIEKYYHYYNKNAEPRVVVCLLYDEKTNSTARGISVCSRHDKFNDPSVLSNEERKAAELNDLDVGEFIAKQQAVRALKERKVENFKHDAVFRRLIECEVPYTKKAEKNPDLAFFERRMLFGNNFHKHRYYRNKAKGGWIEAFTELKPIRLTFEGNIVK